MTAKNPRARHRRFLSSGFFPPELPPCFYSEKIGKYRNSIATEFSKIPVSKNGDPDFHLYRSQKTTFSFPRFRNSDRHHSFINPIAFFFLSRVLSDHYVQLKSICRKSKLSASPSVFDWSGERALKRPSFDARDAFMADINARFEYIVNTDIRAFYHSIYTHAIAWAIHGKEAAKKNRSTKRIGNLIDKLSRNAQDGQTIGIPVGPDTSRLIAELVGNSIDVEAQKKLKKIDGRGIRFVDDFTIGCKDRFEAEKAIAVIRKAVNLFELDINNEKTSISGAITTPPGGWKALVRSLIPKPPIPICKDVLEIFFFRVSELAQQMPSVNIEKFALRNSRSTLVNCTDWRVAENYMISLYKSNPTVLDTMVEIFILRHQHKGDVSLPTVTSFIEARLPLLCDHQRSGEVYWLLFMAIAMEIKIDSSSIEGFFNEEVALSALMISDAYSKGLINGKVNFSTWNKHFTTDDLDGEMWLYAYEATLKGLPGATAGDGFIRNHKYFSKLLDKKIDFYRSGEGVMSINRVLHRRKLENAASKRIAAKLEKFPVLDAGDIDEIDDDLFDDEELY